MTYGSEVVVRSRELCVSWACVCVWLCVCMCASASVCVERGHGMLESGESLPGLRRKRSRRSGRAQAAAL